MFRDDRLTATADFRRTYASGRRASAGAVVAHAFSTGQARPAKVGFSASRAIGGAVRRNRAKRRLREAVRAIGRPLDPGFDVVFIATGDTNRVEFQKLVNSVREAAGNAGAIGA